MRGDERVSQLRDARETGQISVESEPESLAARMAQGPETGLGGAGAISIGRDELHRALEFGLRDRRILRRYFLIRSELDAVAGEFLPVARPVAAEPTITVIDQPRPRTSGRRFDDLGGLTSGCVWHDIDRDWRRVGPRRLLSRQMGIGALSRCPAHDRDETRLAPLRSPAKGLKELERAKGIEPSNPLRYNYAARGRNLYGRNLTRAFENQYGFIESPKAIAVSGLGATLAMTA